MKPEPAEGTTSERIARGSSGGYNIGNEIRQRRKRIQTKQNKSTLVRGRHNRPASSGYVCLMNGCNKKGAQGEPASNHVWRVFCQRVSSPNGRICSQGPASCVGDWWRALCEFSPGACRAWRCACVSGDQTNRPPIRTALQLVGCSWDGTSSSDFAPPSSRFVIVRFAVSVPSALGEILQTGQMALRPDPPAFGFHGMRSGDPGYIQIQAETSMVGRNPLASICRKY